MTLFRRNNTSDLDDQIAKLTASLDVIKMDATTFQQTMTRLERLTELRASQRKSKVSPETMAMVAGNLLGILIIVGYERGHVMTSKGLGHVLKNRVQD